MFFTVSPPPPKLLKTALLHYLWYQELFFSTPPHASRGRRISRPPTERAGLAGLAGWLAGLGLQRGRLQRANNNNNNKFCSQEQRARRGTRRDLIALPTLEILVDVADPPICDLGASGLKPDDIGASLFTLAFLFLQTPLRRGSSRRQSTLFAFPHRQKRLLRHWRKDPRWAALAAGQDSSNLTWTALTDASR